MPPTPESRERAKLWLALTRMSQDEIALNLGISISEFQRDYAMEIKTARATMFAECQAAMYRAAAQGDPEAVAFIAEMRAKKPAKWPSLQEIKRQ